MPKNESLIQPPSHCPQCGRRLAYRDLVPVFSWLFLRGRCRTCQKKIPVFYPIMELITGLLFVLMLDRFGFSGELLVALALVSMLVIITISDIHYMMIPDKVLLVFSIVFIGLRLAHPLTPWWDSLLGAAVGLFLLLLIAIVSRGGMGGGDIKLYAVLGWVLGTKLVILSLIFASFYGTLFGCIGLLSGTLKRGKPIAFGLFIALGTLTAYLYGNSLIQAYMNWIYQ
ncbi:prepilin peptidase [Pullulanibacillus sp. KACC 23026]|uniref:prepilin peptidase n=1 Tax=Pullulanibacillus sp. KACC 23026 TaxID=3028315 RepID=UPI0031B60AE2